MRSADRRLISSAIAAVLALSVASAARADTAIHDAWGNSNLIGGPGCNAPFNAIQLDATRGPADGSPPFQGNLILALSDIVYTNGPFNCFESSTWTSSGTGRRAAKITGVTMNLNPTSVDDLYLPIPRVITLRDLTLDNVDLDYDNQSLGLQPATGDSSLTLRNGSLTGLDMPVFWNPARLTLTASGTSSLKGWTGAASSGTALSVLPGGTLTFEKCGDMNQTIVTSSLYFDQVLGNTATVDGGTLRLFTSWVTFGRNFRDPAHPERDSNMTFQNGAALELAGDRSILEADNFFFLGSAVRVGRHKLKSRGTVTLNAATVSLDEGGKMTSEALDVFGNDAFALPKEFRIGAYSVSTGVALLEPDSPSPSTARAASP